MILNDLEMRLECGRINQLMHEYMNAGSIEYMEHCRELLLSSIDEVRKYKTKKLLEKKER